MTFLKNKSVRILIIALSLILLVIGGFGIYYGRALFIKKIGINVKPTKMFKPYGVNYYLQNDSKWEKNPIGSSRYTMGGHGCLISVLATSMDYLGYETDPQGLNTIFSNQGVYTENGDVIWYKINEAIPQINYEYKRVFESSTIEKDLEEGRLPIVKVKYHKSGIHHWVLIVGADKDGFLISDPLNENKSPMPLGVHGRVYAYRVLVKD